MMMAQTGSFMSAHVAINAVCEAAQVPRSDDRAGVDKIDVVRNCEDVVVAPPAPDSLQVRARMSTDR